MVELSAEDRALMERAFACIAAFQRVAKLSPLDLTFQEGAKVMGRLRTRLSAECGVSVPAASASAPDAAKQDDACRKCGGAMKPGKAMGQTVHTGDEGTCSPAGPGHLTYCLKCELCGWSVAAKHPDKQGGQR